MTVTRDPRWAKLVRRDRRADGKFFYSVRSTGVFCRPTCSARLPRPENVQFHSTADAALRAGFRPCKRCKPTEASAATARAEKIAEVCAIIRKAETIPKLGELARHVGLSRFHFHRLFKATTGLTPRAFATAHRAERVRGRLGRSSTVTDAIYAAGYVSNGRFYAQSNKMLGMKPTTYRKGGANVRITFAVGKCSLGSVLVAATERGVCAIFLGDDPKTLARDLRSRFPKAELKPGGAKFERTLTKVVRFVEAPKLGLELPLDIRGTAFQERVWRALSKIPAGATASYSEVARRLGAPKSTRAVATACAANLIAVAIPCHRVLRTDGTLSGYRWGVKRKRTLLKREARSPDPLQPGTR